MTKLTIDGKKVTARKNETVLEVCRREGIYVPTLCYHERLSPYGGCRLCIVEVEGNPRPMTACTLPVQEGMVVRTNTQLLQELRKFTIQLILSEHPHSCLICTKKEECANYMECIEKEPITFGCKFCSKNGDCELQKLVEEFGIRDIPFQFSYRGLEPERYDPFFERDYNLCILCGRCVRICQEVRGAGVLDFHHRGPQTLVGTAFDLKHLDVDCQFCGACIDVCPTGALAERYRKYLGQEDKKISSLCPLCSLACKISLSVKNGEVINSAPDDSDLCVRGRFGIAPMINHPKRITEPLLKKNGRTVKVTWDEALNYAAERLRENLGFYGVIFSRSLPLEALASLKGLKGGYFGVDGSWLSTKSLNLNCLSIKSALIILCTDIIDDFSVLLLKIKKKYNLPLIVIDPIQTKTVKMADVWLRPEPGKETEFLRLILSRSKLKPGAHFDVMRLAEARGLLYGRKPVLIYNQTNIKDIKLPEGIHHLTLSPLPSIEKVLEFNPIDMSRLVSNPDLKALYLIGETPCLSRAYETVIIQDLFLPPFDFDIFLPAAGPGEFDGSFINIEGKKVTFKKGVEPQGEAMSDKWIIDEIVRRMEPIGLISAPDLNFEISYRDRAEIYDKYPFHLLVRDNCYRFRGFSLSSVLKGFERIHQDHSLWINPGDARRLKLKTGQMVEISGEDLMARINIFITEAVPRGSVFAYRNPALGIIKNQPVRLKKIG
ncbi:MAG: 2Fe-2S iron-sulfur cluster-binding protein [candidate division WOR-3 bacterium]